MINKMTERLEFQGNALLLRAERQRTIASNIANVDSAVASNGEPYKARRIVFTPIPVSPAEPKVAKVAVTAIVEDQSPPRMSYNPAHPLADANGYVTMPNINPVEEMTDMMSATRSFTQAATDTTAYTTLSVSRTSSRFDGVQQHLSLALQQVADLVDHAAVFRSVQNFNSLINLFQTQTASTCLMSFNTTNQALN